MSEKGIEGDDYVYTTKGVTFRWKREKADLTERRRGIGIEEAATVFFDRFAIWRPDKDLKNLRGGHYIGMSRKDRMLVMVHAEIIDDLQLRIITSWPAVTKDERAYIEAQRPKADAEVKRSRRRSSRDPKRRPTFAEFFRRHHPSYSPALYSLPRAGTRSRQTGPMARIQERAWAEVRATKLSTTGKRLRALRKLRGWPQAELARRSGVTASTISRAESGKEKLGLRRGEALAEALGVGPAELLWGRR